MSTLRQTADSYDSTPNTTGASARETYGGENLPVLIRLPDLTDPAGPEVAVAQAAPAVDQPAVATDPAEQQQESDEPATLGLAPYTAWDSPAPEATEQETLGQETLGQETLEQETNEQETLEQETNEQEAHEQEAHEQEAHEQEAHEQEATAWAVEPPPSEPLRERPAAPGRQQGRQRRQDRARRRDQQRVVAPAWLRSLGQLALAVMLAGILFAVIVTVKNWNQGGEVAPRTDPMPLVEAPSLDFGQPIVGPAVGVGEVPQPDLGLPNYAGYGASLEPAATAAPSLQLREDPQQVATEATAGNAPALPAYREYPTTGIPELSAPGSATPNGWRETLPVGPVRNADRSAPPSYDHIR